MIVDVTSRHGWASQKRETPSYLTYRDHRRSAQRHILASAGESLSGYARQPPASAELLTLIDALLSSWLTRCTKTFLARSIPTYRRPWTSPSEWV